MDNLTHTLVGAALGQAGLKRRTGLAMPALMIGANLPDIDVLGLPFGENLAWRRGWTHGPLALVVLPALLALGLMAYDRWQARRGTRPTTRAPVRTGPLLLLSYIGTLSHPLLDLMNNYGVRLLMPFSDRWFYGDTLFIIDPWIILALGAGVWFARGGSTRPALAALAAVTLYTGAMAAGGRAAEQYVARHFDTAALGKPVQIMAGPVPLDPFRRAVIVRMEDRYGFGEFGWLPAPHFTLDPAFVPSNMTDPAVAAAARKEKTFADFLYWSRFPFAAIRRSEDTAEVSLNDARFANGPTRGSFTRTTTLSNTEAGPTP